MEKIREIMKRLIDIPGLSIQHLVKEEVVNFSLLGEVKIVMPYDQFRKRSIDDLCRQLRATFPS